MDTAAAPTFAVLLRRHRLAAGLTQEQLAERANLSVRAVSDLERGLRTAPRRETVDLLAVALDLSPPDRTALAAAVSRQRAPVAHAETSSLPAELTPLIGREQEEAHTLHLLRWDSVRLLTLTGPGGIGKTRLALRVAHSLAGDFSDPPIFVSLASTFDAALVPTTIATTLGLSEPGGRSIEDILTEYLQPQARLLVLDNFEHLLAAAPFLARLLATCPDLIILVTSRAPLHLQLEQEVEVPPLHAPAPWELPSHIDAGRSPAVTLFVQRARAVRSDFGLNDRIAPVLAEICYRLDGLPLAIELAAARIKLFPPEELLRRIAAPLALLTGGATDLPLRQQTLRNTIDWSHSLLSEGEQALFARLSVFAGGCTFDAAEAVCNPAGDLDLLEGLASLVDKSLLRQYGEEEARFRMLETIRQYAAEKLVERGEEEAVRRRHAEYFVLLAEAEEPELTGAEQGRQIARLEREHDNLRRALAWSVAADGEIGLRIATNLGVFWDIRGYLREGLQWLEAVLRASDGVGDAYHRSWAFSSAANLAHRQGDFRRAQELHERALRLRRETGDTPGVAGSLFNLGRVARLRGELERAQQLFEESLHLYGELGNGRGEAMALNSLGIVMQQQRSYERARDYYEVGLRLMRQSGDQRGIAITTSNLASVLALLGEHERADGLYRESLRLGRELGARQHIAESLAGLGFTAVHRQEHRRAMRLLGAAQSIAALIGVLPDPTQVEMDEILLRAAGTALSAEECATARQQGAAMSLEEAVRYALHERDRNVSWSDETQDTAGAGAAGG